MASTRVAAPGTTTVPDPAGRSVTDGPSETYLPATGHGIRPVGLTLYLAALAAAWALEPQLVAFVAAVAVVIAGHEAAHGIVAHRAGRKVHELTVGLGPKTPPLAWFTWREVRFALKPIPIGGYCSFDETDLPGRQEIPISLTGPIYSLVTGWIAAVAWLAHQGHTGALAAGTDLTARLATFDISQPELGADTFLSAVAVYTIVLSVTAGISNLIPLLPFDGGRAVHGAITHTGRRVTARTRTWWTRAGYGTYLFLVWYCAHVST